MKQYIVLSATPWRAVPTRTQQLATRLRDREVLFFQPSTKDTRAYKNPGRKVRPHVTLYTLPPVHPLPENAQRLRRRMWRNQADFIQKTAAHHSFHAPVLWASSPSHVHLLDHLSYQGLIYDCDTLWSALPPQWEGDLAAAADVVFAASHVLMERLSPCNANIALLPNGVNFPMFSRTDLEVPPELCHHTGPLLGWVGEITPDLDLAPVEYAAGAHPDWTFALVGKVGENPRLGYLEELGNVHLLGRRPMVEIPDYIGSFDVCLDLRRREQEESAVIPRRIYEYLSTGKPIVTHLAPEQVEEFPDVIYGAHSLQEYCRMCERAMVEDRSWVSPRRRDYGAAAAWSRRAETIHQILNSIGLH